MLTIQYLYYNQPQAIAFFESIGYNKLCHKFLFVDDASAQPLHLEAWKNAEVFRIQKDTPWNQPAANNLAFWHIYNKNTDAVVLRMDIDHYFKPSDLEKVAQIKLKPKEIIHFKREDRDVHPNIYLARVSDLLNAGGYNESFCGNYGYDDKEMMFRLRKKGFKFSVSELKTHVNNNFGTKNLSRDASINQKLYQKLTSQ